VDEPATLAIGEILREPPKAGQNALSSPLTSWTRRMGYVSFAASQQQL
jgi:hypothetical protein